GRRAKFPPNALALNWRVVLAGFGRVHDVPECFEIIGAAILIFEVIGMFPRVTTQNRNSLGSADAFAHQWIVLVGRRNNLQVSFVPDQPGPTAAEAPDPRGLEFFFEGIKVAKSCLDIVR